MRYAQIAIAGPFPRPVLGYLECTEADHGEWAKLGFCLVPISRELADELRATQESFEATDLSTIRRRSS